MGRNRVDPDGRACEKRTTVQRATPSGLLQTRCTKRPISAVRFLHESVTAARNKRDSAQARYVLAMFIHQVNGCP
jgi:hypothetical protein